MPTHSSLGRGPEAWQGICGEPSLARGAPQHTADTSPPALPGARLNSTGQTGPEGVVPPAMPTSCSSAYASRTPAGAIPPTKRCTHHRTLDSQWSVLKRSGTSAVGLYGPPMRRVILTPEVAFTSCPGQERERERERDARATPSPSTLAYILTPPPGDHRSSSLFTSLFIICRYWLVRG